MSEFEDNIRVVGGNPTAEELAAVIALIEAAAAEEKATAVTRVQPRSTWNRNIMQMRGGIAPGFGQWNASFRDGLN